MDEQLEVELHFSCIPDDSCFEEHILNATDVAVIQSPNFPESYPYNYNCTYIARTMPTHHLVLDFDVFELEPSRLCTLDRLESYTGNVLFID